MRFIGPWEPAPWQHQRRYKYRKQGYVPYVRVHLPKLTIMKCSPAKLLHNCTTKTKLLTSESPGLALRTSTVPAAAIYGGAEISAYRTVSCAINNTLPASSPSSLHQLRPTFPLSTHPSRLDFSSCRCKSQALLPCSSGRLRQIEAFSQG